MGFKVGDKVKVREDLIEGKTYGSDMFVDTMNKFKGRVVTIKEVTATCYGNKYRIKEGGYSWSELMLRPYIETDNKVEILKDEFGSEYISLIVLKDDHEFNIQFYLDRIKLGEKEVNDEREAFNKDRPMCFYSNTLEVSFDIKDYSLKKLKKKMTKEEIEKKLGYEIDIVE